MGSQRLTIPAHVKSTICFMEKSVQKGKSAPSRSGRFKNAQLRNPFSSQT